MTAVFSFQGDKQYPVIVGDLLLSSPPFPGAATCFPTFEDATVLFPKKPDWIACGLKQKVSVIGDRLAIGWSGNYEAAKDAITHLYIAHKTNTLTEDYLESYLMSLGDNGPGFCGYLLEGGKVIRFGYRYKYFDTDHIGRVGMLGSGTTQVEPFVRQLDCTRVQVVSSQNPNEPNLADRTVATAMEIAGALLTEELATGSSLRDHHFGGAYEIAYRAGDRFSKLDDITYAFWNAMVVSDDEILLSRKPLHIITIGYAADVLTVRSFSIDLNSGPIRVRHWYDRIGPLYRHVEGEELNQLPLPNLNTRWLCNFVLMQGNTAPVISSSVERRQSSPERGLTLRETPEGISIGVEPELLERIARQLRETHRNAIQRS
jgi:hypothetical protein